MASKDGNTFGGQIGVAEGAIRTRKDRLDEEERKSMGESPKQSPNTQPDNSDGKKRPPPSKKWFE
jgi:hypothetical protein